MAFHRRKCIHCKAPLPTLAPPNREWFDEDVCGPSCYLHHMLTLGGIHGALSGRQAIVGRKAIDTLSRGRGS